MANGMAKRSTLYRLIDTKLPATFEEFIAERRPHQSWQVIAAEITEITGEQLTKEILRRWFEGRITYRAVVDADERVA